MRFQPAGLGIRLALTVGLILASVAATAQPAKPEGQPTRLRGTVQHVDGQSFTVLSNAKETVPVTLAEGAGILGMARRSLEDIKDGDFVGVTASAWKDGRLHATEVHIFPESMRGAGEGHYPWDFPETTMTNATVTGVMAGGDGRTVKLIYKDGQTAIDIAPDTPIVTLVPGDRSLLKPGAAVFVLGLKKPDGTVEAYSVAAEKDGVKPPM